MTRLTLLLTAMFLLSGGRVQAGFLVGNSADIAGVDQNDSEADVKLVIDDYNASHDPDLIKTFGLFKKTDDDAGDVFNATNNNNGFSFFEADMTTAITSGTLQESSLGNIMWQRDSHAQTLLILLQTIQQESSQN